MKDERTSLHLRLVEGRSVRISAGDTEVEVSIYQVEAQGRDGLTQNAVRLRFRAPRYVTIMRSDAKHIREVESDRADAV